MVEALRDFYSGGNFESLHDDVKLVFQAVTTVLERSGYNEPVGGWEACAEVYGTIVYIPIDSKAKLPDSVSDTLIETANNAVNVVYNLEENQIEISQLH